MNFFHKLLVLFVKLFVYNNVLIERKAKSIKIVYEISSKIDSGAFISRLNRRKGRRIRLSLGVV